MSQFLKPSELPVDTVIEIGGDKYDRYIKVDNEIWGISWEPLSCQDCQGSSDYSDNAADVKFKSYRIVSVPYSIVADLAEDAAFARGMHVDQVITEAVRKANG